MLNSSVFDRVPVRNAGPGQKSIHRDGAYHNARATSTLGFWGGILTLWRLLTKKSREARPQQPVDVVRIRRADLQAAPDGSLWRLGHSSLLMKLNHCFWLIDPVYAQRASPLPFAGPKRFHAPPIAREDLPEIEAVILTHDHYDHLDRHTVCALAPRVRHFLAPLGVGDRLIAWGIEPDRVQQLDWWQEAQVGGLRLIATPAQHFSGRGLGDHNTTLWASWVILAPGLRLFFSGDGGYFSGFGEIGQQFGPFDVACIENGAYDPGWPDVHMQPEQTLQAFLDLRARCLLPIHNGTFDLSFHGWTEPLERIHALAAKHDVALCTPRFGERVDLSAPAAGHAWWRAQRQMEQGTLCCAQSGKR